MVISDRGCSLAIEFRKMEVFILSVLATVKQHPSSSSVSFCFLNVLGKRERGYLFNISVSHSVAFLGT